MDQMLSNALFARAITQPDATPARIASNIVTALSLLCLIFLAGFIATRFNQKSRDYYRDFFGDKVNLLLWLVPTVAMAFSLTFSNVFGWTPCRLCWYQRACIYPLAVLMLFYFFTHLKIVRRIGYLFAAICPFISAYHIGIEIRQAESPFCSAEVSCATIWIKPLGFLSIPTMALIASLTVLVLLYMSGRIESARG